MVTLFRYGGAARGRPAGTWKPLRLADGRLSATVACPGCGEVATLEDHTVDPYGRVAPSLVCPRSCGFHDHVMLSHWEAAG